MTPKTWKYKQLWELRPDPSSLKKIIVYNFFLRFYLDLFRFIVLQRINKDFIHLFIPVSWLRGSNLLPKYTVQLLLHFLYFFMLAVFPLSRYMSREDIGPLWLLIGWIRLGTCWVGKIMLRFLQCLKLSWH